LSGGGDLDPQRLAEQAPQWWHAAEKQFTSGEGIKFGGNSKPPLAPSKSVPTPHHWIPFPVPGMDPNGLVFDLTPNGGDSILLFAFRPEGRVGLGRLPSTPTEPRSASQGLQIGVWQNNGVVYVLVVKGPERRFQQTISHGPEFA
jgi:hypothetical protein